MSISKSTQRLLVLLLLTSATSQADPTTQPANDWKPLFNGKDFTGWYTYLQPGGRENDIKKIFQVDGGVIHIYKEAADASTQPFGYVATNEEFGDCRIRLQYKWGTKRFGSRSQSRRDSGLIYFFTGKDGAFGGGPWPYGVEFQIQENDVGDIYCVGTQCSTTIDPAKKPDNQPTFMDRGAAYTSPPTGNNRIVRNPMAEMEGWNTIELILDGDGATHIVNGKVNMRISQVRAPDPADKQRLVRVKKGKILLQAEGAEVMYRNIEVQGLNK